MLTLELKKFSANFSHKKALRYKSRGTFYAEAFRCYSTKYIKLYDGVLDLLDTLKGKKAKK
ncbi:haloacid dehalogenase superfamily, partial [human gut metagenome]